MAAIGAALERAGAPAEDIEEFSHGMTVATNALLEGRGARTAFVATAGIHRPDRARPPGPAAALPAVRRPAGAARARRAALRRPRADDPGRAARRADRGRRVRAGRSRRASPSPRRSRSRSCTPTATPSTSGRSATRSPTRLPDAHVSLSHEVVGTFREFERAATTEIDAALSPLLARYLRRLAQRAREAAMPEPAIMQSNGGLIDIAAAAGHASWTVLSGPAGGAAGAAFVARQAGVENALCLDMGGTSCDVCVVDDGAVQERSSGEVAGRPLALPMLAVHTVGAGGGSIAWRDARRRAARRSALGRRGPGARVLRARRHRTDGHRRQPRARLPVRGRPARRRRRARSRPRRKAPSSGSPTTSASAYTRAPRGSAASPPPRCSARCGSSRCSAGSTRGATR